MGINRVVKCFLIVLTVIGAGSPVAKNYETSDYGLFLSPESCFLLDKINECDIVVTIAWEVLQKGNYCLYNHLNKNPINCWKDKKQATTKIELKLKQDIYFELRYQESDKIIFNTSLKLYKKMKQLKRKRRNPWSFY